MGFRMFHSYKKLLERILLGLAVASLGFSMLHAEAAEPNSASSVRDEPTSDEDRAADRMNTLFPRAAAQRRYFHAVVFERNNVGGYGVYSRAKGSLVTGIRTTSRNPYESETTTNCLFTIVGDGAAHWTRRCIVTFPESDARLGYSGGFDGAKAYVALSAGQSAELASIMLGYRVELENNWKIIKYRSNTDQLGVLQALAYPYGYVVGAAIGTNPWTAIPVGIVAAGVAALEIADVGCVDERYDALKAIDGKHFMRLFFMKHTPKCEAGFKH